MCQVSFIKATFFAVITLLIISFSDVCSGLSFSILPITGGSNQTLPPDASPVATPSFDVHRGQCPEIKFDCENVPVRYYCVSDLACFSFQKCCLYSCNYVCTISMSRRNATTTSDDAAVGDVIPKRDTDMEMGHSEPENEVSSAIGFQHA